MSIFNKSYLLASLLVFGVASLADAAEDESPDALKARLTTLQQQNKDIAEQNTLKDQIKKEEQKQEQLKNHEATSQDSESASDHLKSAFKKAGDELKEGFQ